MKKLVRYLKPYWFLALISPLMMIGEVAADLCLPYLMSFIVNYGVLGIPLDDPESGSVLASSILRLFVGTDPTQMQMIVTFGLLMLVITLVGGFFGTFCAWTAATASQRFGHDLRCDAFRHVMALSIEQTDRFTTGSLVTRMTNDVTQLVDFCEMILRMFVRSPMFFVGGTLMVLTLDVRFSVVLMCALPVLIVAIVLIIAKAVPLFSVVQKKLDKVNAVVQENVSGARVVKAFTREEYECERFGKANAEMRDTNLRVSFLLTYIHPILTVVQAIVTAAILYIGGLRANIEGSGMTVGAVMAAVTYVTQVVFSVMMITMLFQSVSRAMASAQRVTELLDSDPAVIGGLLAEAKQDSVSVEFRHVDFKYPNTTGRNVLTDINLTIHRGETLAVIGATGTGKSSLIQLIPRFYDASGGEVLIDGKPVKDYELGALRRKIGYVMQKSELFSDTVANNIKWGKPDATDAEVRAAADVAQATDFVLGFNDDFETFIAEKGASLSGGQKQRLSIARALIRHPEILILDDATSALDLATEAKLQKALRSSFDDSTVIMIAQRIASVRAADRIAVIEADGRILHCAPHDQLLKESETYRDIYESQMRSGALCEGGEA